MRTSATCGRQSDNCERSSDAEGSGENKIRAADICEADSRGLHEDQGVGQVFGGAGSPGGRTDVWQDQKLLSFDPIYTTIVKAFPQGPGSLRYSANFHYADLTKAVNDELTPYFKQEASLADATTKAVQTGNAILSQ